MHRSRDSVFFPVVDRSSRLGDRCRSGLCFLVLVLVLEWGVMTEPIFDHEKLDVYRLSIEYVTASYGIAKGLTGVNRHIRDQWLRAAQSIPLNIAEGNGKQSLKDKNRFFSGSLAVRLCKVRRFTICSRRSPR
jgi:hypothetical protein